MNTLKKILYLTLVSLFITSCSKDYDDPSIPEPQDKEKTNISIAKLKEKYANTISGTPTLIDVSYVITGYVTANDESGNIFKQIYIEDESGAISISVDQTSVYTILRVGQEVFVNLHGLSMVNYGGELQLGFANTTANRIPWEVLKEHISLNKWPDAANVIPTLVSLDNLTSEMVNKLVRIDNIYFVNGGKNTFTSNNETTSETIKDANGNTLDVRTSSYSNFASTKLPLGSGSIVGILGRFNNSWQFILRSTKDLISFGGDLPAPPSNLVIFMETFGTGTYLSGNRPKISDFKNFDMKSPIVYSDATGNADIRSISGDNGAHVWLPPNLDSQLKITGINTSNKTNLKLSYLVAANLYDANSSGNLNVLTVKCNGVALNVPSTPVSNANGDNAKFYTFSFDNIPAVDNLTLEFATTSNANTLGLRLDNIKIEVKNDGIILEPTK